jgi:hypothetical protein
MHLIGKTSLIFSKIIEGLIYGYSYLTVAGEMRAAGD